MEKFRTASILVIALIIIQGCASTPESSKTTSAFSVSSLNPVNTPYFSEWDKFEDRIWIGSDMWTSDIGSWQIKSGKLLCQTTTDGLHQSTLLTRRILAGNKPVSMSIILGNTSEKTKYDAAGFLLGIPPATLNNIDENSDAPQIFAGVMPSGKLVLEAKPTLKSLREAVKSEATADNQPPDEIKLMLTAMPIGNRYTVLLQQFDNDRSVEISRQTLWNVPASLVQGYTGLGCISRDKNEPLNIMFNDWVINGTQSVVSPDNESKIGPIVGAWHTLHKNTLRMTAQLMPVGKRLNIVKLQTFADGKWTTKAQSEVRSTDFTASFSIKKWDSSRSHPYRLEYGESLSDGSIRRHYWSGTISSANMDCITILESTPVTHPSLVTPPVSPDIHVLYDIETPPHTKQSLGKLQKWYGWCLKTRELGRNTPCLGIYHHKMTYNRAIIEIAKSAAPQNQIPKDDWNSWSDADIKLICAPDMYKLVAKRDDPDKPTPEILDKSKAIYTASTGIGYVQLMPSARNIIYNRIATTNSPDAKAGSPLEGWPITCKHNMAYDREHVGYLPPLEIMGKPNALIQVINDNNGNLVYSLRSDGTAFLPRVFRIGHYTINIGEPEAFTKKTFPNLTPNTTKNTPAIRVAL